MNIAGGQKVLKRVKSGRVKKKEETKKCHEVYSKEDVVQAFVGQMKASEGQECIEHSSKVKMGKNLKKQLLKKRRHKSKHEAHNLVDKNGMKEKLSSIGKRKQFSERLQRNKPGVETSVEIDGAKKRREREKRRLRRAKQKVLS